MKRCLFAVFILLICSPAFALLTDIGLDPMDQTGTAIPLGMGNAHVASFGDMNSFFYNPASLAYSEGILISVNSAKNYAVGLGYETPLGNFGFGMNSRAYDGLLESKIKTSYEQSNMLLGYAYSFGNWSLGAASKALISQRYKIENLPDESTGRVDEADVGILMKPYDQLSIGLVFHNILGTKFTIASSNESMPTSTKLGIAINLYGESAFVSSETFGMKVAYDVESGKAGDGTKQNSYYGIETCFYKWFYLRAGAFSVLKQESNADGSTFGVGIKNRDTSFDLASVTDPWTGSSLAYFAITYNPPTFVLFEEKKPVRPAIKRRGELLIVSAPSEEMVTYNDMVSVEGKADPLASVAINGVPVYLEQDGRFQAMQSLLAGKNLIEISAKLGSENKVINKRVLRKAKVVVAEEAGLNKKIVDEVLNKEGDILKKEAKIQSDRKKGLDVSKQEESLAQEKEVYESRKNALYSEKAKLDERKEKVENLVTLGVIEVSKEKSFQIEAKITRAEMITWLVKAAGLPIPKVEGPVFDDVPANSEYAPYIKSAYNGGFIRKPIDNKFRPNEPVTDIEGQQFFRAFGIMK